MPRRNWKQWLCKVLESTRLLWTMQISIWRGRMTLSHQTVACFGHCDYFMKCRAIVILLLLGRLLHPGPKCITLRTFLSFRAKTYYTQDLYCIQGHLLHLRPQNALTLFQVVQVCKYVRFVRYLSCISIILQLSFVFFRNLSFCIVFSNCNRHSFQRSSQAREARAQRSTMGKKIW